MIFKFYVQIYGNLCFCAVNCPENFVLYDKQCYWPSQSVNLVGTKTEAEYICEQLDSRLAILQSAELASLIRVNYEFGATTTLIGLKRSGNNYIWPDDSLLSTDEFWESDKAQLTSSKCVHASLCNSTNPLKYYVVGCDSIAPFLCQAQKCPDLSTFQHYNLTKLKAENYIVGSKVILECDEEYSITGSSIYLPIECQSDGTWNSSTHCTVHVCPAEPIFRNSVKNKIYGNGNRGTILEYTCKSGYNGNYSDDFKFTAKCQVNGWQWVDNIKPDCNRKFLKYFL